MMNNPIGMPLNGRRSLSEEQWKTIKEAVDIWRTEGYAAIAMEDILAINDAKLICWSMLSPLDLWDEEKDTPDEELIKELYMRRA